MNWISRKLHLYNVTMGLYMLDRWERFLFSILFLVLQEHHLLLLLLLLLLLDIHNAATILRVCKEAIFLRLWAFLTLIDMLILVFLWFVCYNGSRSATEFYER